VVQGVGPEFKLQYCKKKKKPKKQVYISPAEYEEHLSAGTMVVLPKK
jgi:hypothetical protein